MQLDSVLIVGEPLATRLVEPMPWAIVEDDEELPSAVPANEQLQEEMESVAVEFRRELIREACVVQRDGAVEVRRLPHAVGIDARLNTDATPRLMERPIEPEARLVLEENYSAASPRFFLSAGNCLRNQNACFSRSARARRLRGR